MNVGMRKGVDDQGRIESEKKGMPVRRGLGDELGADIAARTAAVFNDYRLTQGTRQPFGDRARTRIGCTTGTERDDEPDRPGRIERVLGACIECRYGEK